MRKLPQTLNKIISESGLKTHKISQASGISNTYLAKLIKGQINRPGKDKIASILLALNYTISTINEVLADYDYGPLHREDIPEILKNNSSRKIKGGNLPQYDHIYFDLLLVALERIGGVKILLKDRPSGVFMPHELYMMKEFPYEENNAATRFRYHLIEELLKERNQLFIENCHAGYRLDTYICANCLEEYLERNIGPIARKDHPRRTLLVTRYFANALSLALKLPQLHRLMITERCPYFHLQIQDAEGTQPKVSYSGRKVHSYNNQSDRRNFEGITTDLPHLVAHFRQEVDMCQQAVLPAMETNYPESIKTYLFDLFHRFNMEDTLQTELSELMGEEQIRFF